MVDPPNMGFGMTGVAPEASLYMYRIFSCVSESTTTDIIMAAMIQAAADGVDVISMSLGAMAPFQDNTPYTTLVNSITGQGIAVIAANGNDGDLGIYGQSTPASVESALGVGSVTNLKFPVNYNLKDSTGATFQYQAVWPLILPQALSVYSHGLECTPAAWEHTGAAVKDPANTIVLVGTTPDCSLGTQMSAASAFGIQYLIGYNIGQDPVSQDAELQIPFPVTTLVIDPRSGASMLRHIKSAGSTYSLSFTDPTASSVRMLTGAMVSNFSSFGPTWDTVALKPQLSEHHLLTNIQS
jgi:Subtilase family